MNFLDYIVVIGYLAILLYMGFALRQQENKGDYFLGGRTLGWKPLTLSVMATQLSAISFISAPAFVGLRDGGGMIWCLMSWEFHCHDPAARHHSSFIVQIRCREYL